MNRRDFLGSLAGMTGILAVPGLRATAADPAQAPFLLSADGSSRATGYAEANKIVTVGEKTHVAWLDSPSEGFRVRIRTLDRGTGGWSPVHTVGEGYDNHGGPALAVDSEGHLHIAYYPHHHPMRYRRSLRPNDASEWGDEEAVGENGTYPTLVCTQDDTLILTFRVRRGDAPWLVERYTKPKDGAWQGPHALLEAETPGYAHFMEALAWGPDHKTLHLACRLYDGNPGRGHTIGYLQSRDEGATWTRWDGAEVALTATAGSVDVVAQSRTGPGHGLRAGALAVSPEGRPYILCSDYERLESWLAFPEGGAWRKRPIPLPDDAPEGHGLITPGGVTFSEDGNLHAVLTLVAAPEDPDTGLWGHPSCEIAAFSSSDEGESFTSRILTRPDPSLPRWLPNIERATGHNTVPPAPGMLYTEGGRGDTNLELVSNNVYWSR